MCGEIELAYHPFAKLDLRQPLPEYWIKAAIGGATSTTRPFLAPFEFLIERELRLDPLRSAVLIPLPS